MENDLRDVIAEVKTEFERYEQALVSNDVVALNKLFHNDPRTIRYGSSENLYGYSEIAAFRAARSPLGLARALSRTVISSYGRDCAVASTLYHRANAPGGWAPDADLGTIHRRMAGRSRACQYD